MPAARWLGLLLWFTEAVQDLAGVRVAMVVAFEGFRDEELFAPRALLERHGADVTILSDRTGTAVGKLGGSCRVDGLVGAALAEEYAAVVFVGGPGIRAYAKRPDCLALARAAAEGGKVVASICAAGAILAHAGVLAKRRATCYPTEAESLRKAGAIYTGQAVETDGPFVTADGPQASSRFGAAIVQALLVGRKHALSGKA